MCSFRRSLVFSEGVYTARLEKEPGWKREGFVSRRALPDGAGAERSARIAVPRGALPAGRIGQLALQPEERLSLQRCVWYGLHRPGGKCPLGPVCLDQPKRLFSFLPLKNSLSDK